MPEIAFFKKFVYTVFLLASSLVIAVTAIIYANKDVINDLDIYRPKIDGFVSKKLDIKTQTQEIKGRWQHLAPRISISKMYFFDKSNNQPSITLDGTVFEINLIQSIFSQQLVSRMTSISEVNITIEENVKGSWSIAGKELGGKDTGLLEQLFNNRFLKINSINLTLNFLSGIKSTVKLRDISLENEGYFHRLLTKIYLEGNENHIDFVLEANGSEKNLADLDILAYSKLQLIDFNKPLKKIMRALLPNVGEEVIDVEAAISGELWFSAKRNEKYELHGTVSSNKINHNSFKDYPIKKVDTNIYGWYLPEESAGFKFDQLNLSFGDIKIPSTSVSISKILHEESNLISVDKIDLAILSEVLKKVNFAPKNITDLVEKTKPSGRLRNFHLQFTKKNITSDFHLRANLEDVATNSWSGKPGLKKVNGYLDMKNSDGFFELDSPDGFGFKLPNIFDEYIYRSSIRGNISWRYNNKNSALKIFSDLIKMDGEEGQGRAYFYADIPAVGSGLTPQLYLSMGVKNLDARYKESYIPNNLDARLSKWIDQSVIKAYVPEAGLIWRGPISKKKKKKGERNFLGTTQFYLKTADSELKFHPEWPVLTKLNALVVIDSTVVKSKVFNASIGDALLKEANLSISPKIGESPYLSILGTIESDFGAAVDLIKNSPLRARVLGLNNWDLSGKTSISLDLNVPLSANKSNSHHNIDMTLNDGSMSLITTNIFLDRLHGILSYRDEKGLFSNSLTGYFFDEPFDSKLHTYNDDLSIDINGKISMPSVANFFNLQSDQILKGKTNFIANINIALEDTSLPIELHIDSDMKGAEINLPAPFAKQADIKRELLVNIIFDERTNLTINFGEDIKSYLELEKKLITNGVLSIKSDRSELPEENQFLIEGHLKAANLLEWKNIYPQIFNLDDTKDSKLTPIFDVVIDKIEFAGLSVDTIGINGGYQNREWMLGIKSELLEGHLWIPSDPSDLIIADLERLSLPTLSDTSATKDSIHPADFPHLKLSVRNFSVGDKKFGESKLLMIPQENGIKITGINANLLGISIGDKKTETIIEWVVEKDQHSTVFNGSLRLDDIGETLKSWGYPMIMDSKKAQFISQLNWKGKPWQISPESINGIVELNLKDGHFYQDSSGTTNTLVRLVSLFNFDNWIRRLQLDFSDLYEKGMSYNKMSGNLVFETGKLIFDPPVKVDLPSGHIKLAGSANLVTEDIQANLVTMLPVGNNLPWVAAAVGGLPVAAGVFITSKVFEKQVDKLSSITYSIKGPWKAPEVVMEKIFNINTSGKKKPKGEEAISQPELKSD